MKFPALTKGKAAKLPPKPEPPKAAPKPAGPIPGIWVYNPDDEPDGHAYGGETFVLNPNSATEIKSPWGNRPGQTAEDIANHLVAALGRYGVCRVRGPVTGGKATFPEDQATVDAAEAQYLEATRQWSEDAIFEYELAAKPRKDFGLTPPEEPQAVKTAREWLKNHPKKK